VVFANVDFTTENITPSHQPGRRASCFNVRIIHKRYRIPDNRGNFEVRTDETQYKVRRVSMKEKRIRDVVNET
jgi:hypothetical protein